MTKLKIGALVALVSSILLNVWLITRPGKTPETLIVEKEVVREVVVEKVVVADTKTTTTKPDGTVIVKETSKKTEVAKTVKEDKKENSTLVKHEKPKYSLGIEIGRELGLDLITKPNVYRMQLGYRLGDSPLWATVTAGNDRTVLVGLRIEF